MKHVSALMTVLSIFLTAPVAAQNIEVDLELVLMVDVSSSMTERELEIQRRGYAEALKSDAVFAAVQTGLLQNVALTYVEWSGWQDVIVDWSLIENREDLNEFANALTSSLDSSLRRTSISEALVFGAEQINSNTYTGLRRVIDISGDGPNNLGRNVERGRDSVLEQGIVINGLPLLTREGMGASWHLDELDVYYRTCVIGGVGSFVIPVTDWDDFAEAVRRKLVLEIAARPVEAEIIKVQSVVRDPRDCLIGEKIWQQRRDNSWQLP